MELRSILPLSLLLCLHAGEASTVLATTDHILDLNPETCHLKPVTHTLPPTPQPLHPNPISTTDPVTAARELSIRGFLKAERGDHRGAIADYTRALQLDPTNPDLYYNRGVSRAAIGENQGAIADYTEAIRRDPGSGDAYYNRGLTHLVSQNQLLAIADFTQAIHIYEVRSALRALLAETPTLVPDANLPYVYYNRGKALLGLNLSFQGITDLQRAVLLADQTGDRTLARIIRAELSGNP